MPRGRAVKGAPVVLSSFSSSLDFASPTGRTDDNGVFTTTVTSRQAQDNVTVTATETLAGVSTQETTAVTFVAGAPDAKESSIVASPATLTADGTSATTLTVLVRDEYDNPVERPVSLSSTAEANVFTSPSGMTDAHGVFTATLKSHATLSGDTLDTVTATVGGFTETTALTLKPGAPDTSTTESAIADSAVTAGTDGQSYINAAHFNGGSTTLTGTAEAGDTVSVSVDGGAAQAATVAPNGSWSLTLTGLADGQTYSALATAKDAAGNTASSPAFAFSVDAGTTESAIADSALTVGTDGKSYIDAAHFNGGSTTLTGAAEAGDTVSVSVDGAAAQAATVAPNGSWSLTLTGLADGQTYSALATAKDAAGNTASSAAFAFTVDTSTSESAIVDSAVTRGTDSQSYINATHFNSGSTTLTGMAEHGRLR